MNDSTHNLSINSPDKKLKLTQITKFLSQDASTVNKLNDLESVPKDETKKKNAKKLSKKKSKLNFFKLNDTRCLEESILVGDEPDKNSKYFQKSSKKDKIEKIDKIDKIEKIETKENRSDLDNTKQESSNSNRSPFSCPICSIDLTYDDNRQAHVNQCLDKGFSSKNPPKPRKIKETGKSIESQPAKAAIEPAEPAKIPELRIEDAVPNCPICGKVFHTINVFLIYVKLLFFVLTVII